MDRRGPAVHRRPSSPWQTSSIPKFGEDLLDIRDISGDGALEEERGEPASEPVDPLAAAPIPDAPGFPYIDPEKLKQILSTILEESGPLLEPRLVGERLSVRGTPRQLRLARTLAERIRSFASVPVEIDVDVLLAPSRSVLGLVLASPDPVAFDDAGRKDLLERAGKEPGEAAGADDDEMADLSELVRPLREEERRTVKLLAGTRVSWAGKKDKTLSEFAGWLADALGGKARVSIDPGIAAELIVVPSRKMDDVPAAELLDAITARTWFKWTVEHGTVRIGAETDLRESARRDLAIPSIDDYRDEKDRETFRALSRPVEIDLAALKTFPDLFAAIAKATGTTYAASGESFESEEPAAIDSWGSLPPGPKVVPAVLLCEVHPRLWWWIDGGRVICAAAE